jgi:hypothetical protein
VRLLRSASDGPTSSVLTPVSVWNWTMIKRLTMWISGVGAETAFQKAYFAGYGTEMSGKVR